MNNDFTIILTIHNKEWLIQQQLESLKNTINLPIELNIVFDGCTDGSYQKYLSWLNQNKTFKDFHKINEFFASNVFETKANNIGLKAANSKHLVIVQDDMILNEKDWLLRMKKPFEMSDVFSVTARTAHDWVYNPNTKHESMLENLNNCWCDILIHTNHANKSTIDRDIFAVRDSANRGPLMLCHDSLKKLNFLDEEFAPQDMDDHDLNYRAFKELGKVAGCYWIDFISQDEWGGTRITGEPAPWLFEAQHKNTKIVWQRHKNQILGKKHSINRSLK